MRFLLALSLVTFAVTARAAEVGSTRLTVISWNVKHLGRKSLPADKVASLLGKADVVTLQEVNKGPSGLKALQRVAERLKADTKEKICWALSETPTGARERYAYLWKDARLAFVRADGSVLENCPDTALTIRLGVKNADKIVREPAFGTFVAKPSRVRFVLASIHLVPTGKKPQNEVGPLFDTFKDVREPTIVAGDFNLDSSHRAFNAAKAFGFAPAMSGEKTSLKQNERALHKAYDNFWVRDAKPVEHRVIGLHAAFPAMRAREIYRNISDHSPVEAVFELAPRKTASAP